MAQKRLLWHLYPSFLVITIASLMAMTWYVSHSFRIFYHKQLAGELEAKTRLIEYQILPIIKSGNPGELDNLCKNLRTVGLTRITVILPDGRVIADSDENTAQMVNHGDRPEFKEAMTKGMGTSLRFSATLKKNMMYLAIPIKQQNKIIAVVRTSIPVTAVDEELKQIYQKIIWASVLIAICAAAAALAISKKISRPVEQMRRDFVANVSHELKTPVTSIKGFVETLLEGALNEPEQAVRFLKIIAKQSDRLNAIIDDLLTLSTLEEEQQQKEISFELSAIKPVLDAAVELSSFKASPKQILLTVRCESNLKSKINSALLEQAVVNLIDNAVKYSENNKEVIIEAQRNDKELTITVKDQGSEFHGSI